MITIFSEKEIAFSFAANLLIDIRDVTPLKLLPQKLNPRKKDNLGSIFSVLLFPF